MAANMNNEIPDKPCLVVVGYGNKTLSDEEFSFQLLQRVRMSPTMKCSCSQKPEIDLKHLVKKKYGENILICDGNEQKVDNQGYRGLVLRVTYHLAFKHTVSFIVKKPLDGERAATAADRERIFFEKLVPQLEIAIPDLPIVKMHDTHTEHGKTRAIVLEDLCAAGFSETPSSHGVVMKEKKLSMPIALCVAKSLAKIHAAFASSKINERTDVPKIDLIKTRTGFRNLVKDSGKTEMRFIDWQTYYVGPAYIDLLFFIYSSATQDFRAKNEKDLVKKYVETFNVCCADLQIDFDSFWNSYNSARFFGVFVAIGFRTFQLLPIYERNETDKSLKLPDFPAGCMRKKTVVNFCTLQNWWTLMKEVN
ncbi:Hypothetical predicted protein [Cloeon dipterum]|uniref:CHK kinase-like domain-containing protein n=1 Tax=Cloeon dipterum TaxID=197152 RepID=A0A8S1DJD3_9INSE|nr:Hypothetical predicted protein [Cloeon dipterum]